ncbi:hypothetical protein [Streptomyces sp. NRRL S-481]|uniref:hypothetical protein n=1 Tax=Streptomyces sp. NRRL S-481 TaxID=1463911 RepID=UPI001F46F4F5|nr:hypothetical protein [Streptomyces sp. NRRL S-481]
MTSTTGTICPHCGWPDGGEPFQVLSRHLSLIHMAAALASSPAAGRRPPGCVVRVGPGECSGAVQRR